MEVVCWRVDNYRLNRQIGQPALTILACEAAGMVPQLARVAHLFGVPVLSGGGFDSSELARSQSSLAISQGNFTSSHQVASGSLGGFSLRSNS